MDSSMIGLFNVILGIGIVFCAFATLLIKNEKVVNVLLNIGIVLSLILATEGMITIFICMM